MRLLTFTSMAGVLLLLACSQRDGAAKNTVLGGIGPLGSRPDQVESFLRQGGQLWKALVENGTLAGGDEFWIWPAEDVPLESTGTPSVPFRIHWRLRPGKDFPTGDIYYCVKINATDFVAAKLEAGTSEGILDCGLDTRQISGEGVLPQYLMILQSDMKPASNVLLLPVRLQR